jgi:NADH-quinone oxidoreductase subunit L
MNAERLMSALVLLTACAPLALFVVLGLGALLGRPVSERWTGRLTAAASIVALGAAIALCATMAMTGADRVLVSLGDWVSLSEYRFSVTLLADRLSVPMVLLTSSLCGVVGAFASRYLHQEPGFTRFFVLLSLFTFAMTLTFLAGSLENVLAAWEMVGLSSALLIGFFHERPAPVKNGFRTWVVYRLTDTGLLTAAVVVSHAFHGASAFHAWLPGAWPHVAFDGSARLALVIGGFVLLSAMGKSALVPFSGWLPRAMEGPTPSSAIFYGALSVHAGVYLLLRIGPLLDASRVLAVAVVAVGLLTAAYATLVGRVQTDIKSALAFASLTQVGLIVAEIGLGFRWLPLVHLAGHACVRALQLLRAPSLLHDLHQVEQAVGGHLPRTGRHLELLIPPRWRRWAYRFALERAYLDPWLDRVCVRPFLRLLRGLDRIERICTGAGEPRKDARRGEGSTG